ncbi:MAG: hypothetical protein M3Y87_08480 [Myxococcota bacterium]|nr:hypothetical protein [Myxococcota bacterium]
MRPALVATTLALLALLVGCGPEPTTCTPAPLPDCDDVDAPTFAALHAAVIAPSCATGSTCHVPGDTISDLDLSDVATARATLIEGDYVVPGSPECSETTQRITSEDRLFMMPPTGRLSVEQQCAVIAWVRDGAP